jgi:hypothetical protein
MDVNAFIFQRPPEPLEEDVIHPAALAIYRDLVFCSKQHVNKARAGKLLALICVEDGGLAKSSHRFVVGLDAKISFH